MSDKKKNNQHNKPHTQQRALEPRVLFDAAISETIEEGMPNEVEANKSSDKSQANFDADNLPSSIEKNEAMQFPGMVSINHTDSIDGIQLLLDEKTDVWLDIKADKGAITLDKTSNIEFISGSNGSNEIKIAGTVKDTNKAISHLGYEPTSLKSTDKSADKVNFELDIKSGEKSGEKHKADIDVYVMDKYQKSVNKESDNNIKDAFTDNEKSEHNALESDSVIDLTMPSIDSGLSGSKIELNGLGINLLKGNPNAFYDVDLSTSVGEISIMKESESLITAGSNNSQSMHINGSLNDVQRALSILTYKGLDGYNGLDSVNVLAQETGSDKSGIAILSVPLAVKDINSESFVDSPRFLVGLQGSPVPISSVNIDGPADQVMTIRLSSGKEGSFTIPDNLTKSLKITETDKGLSMTGTLNDLNNATNQLTYQTDASFFGTDFLTVSALSVDGAVIGSHDIPMHVMPLDSDAILKEVSVADDNPNSNPGSEIALSFSANDLDFIDDGKDLTVEFQVSSGEIIFKEQSAVQVDYLDNGQVRLVGSLDDIGALTSSFSFKPTEGFSGTTSIGISVPGLGANMTVPIFVTEKQTYVFVAEPLFFDAQSDNNRHERFFSSYDDFLSSERISLNDQGQPVIMLKFIKDTDQQVYRYDMVSTDNLENKIEQLQEGSPKEQSLRDRVMSSAQAFAQASKDFAQKIPVVGGFLGQSADNRFDTASDKADDIKKDPADQPSPMGTDAQGNVILEGQKGQRAKQGENRENGTPQNGDNTGSGQ
jgi:hypothetical protein